MIIGFNLIKILVEKDSTDEPKKIERVSTKTDISNISEQKIEIKEKTALKFSFSFNVDYEKNIAKIKMEGSLLYLADPKQAKEILESWKKKEITKEIRMEIINAVLSRCNIKALGLEEYMGLPAHFPLPKFQIQEEKKNEKSKTGYAG
ncbi:MAG: hypothetical protein NTX24_01125 [Candidatus Pacearchaeota archaeon]|nr:hypothetical protein [Candidatus Pacearchaeota archaeon]